MATFKMNIALSASILNKNDITLKELPLPEGVARTGVNP